MQAGKPPSKEGGFFWGAGMNTLLRQRFVWVLPLLLLLAWGVYHPGMSGLFLLDDYQNLKTLDWGGADASPLKLASIVFSNPSGDSGRWVSMLTFVAQSASWPDDPAAFKTANLAIHLLNGLLLYSVFSSLLALMHVSAPRRDWVALGATALWLLHPMQVSTVLYVVQRMAELSATFTLLGLMAYLRGRRESLERPVRGYVFMSLGLGVCGALAFFSKENGVLLLLYVWVAELTVLRNLPPPPYWRVWKAVVLVLPLLAMGGYFGARFSTWILPGYDLRDFTLGERLLTEARALSDYLGLLLIPRSGAFGLFHDDYVVSHSLFDPPWTLGAVLVVLALLVSAFLGRKRWPVYAFAVLWFFAGHILESTVIPLELYFEHRNYLPSAGVFFALAYSVDYLAKERLGRKIGKTLEIFFLVFCGLLAFMTWSESRLWGNPIVQIITWANEHPNSLRAQLQLATMKRDLGDVKGAEEIYSALSRKEPAIFPLWAALICENSDVRIPAPGVMEEALRHAHFSKLPFGGMEQMVIAKEKGACEGVPESTVLGLFDALLDNPHFVTRRSLYLTLKGRWLTADRQWDGALAAFDAAYRLQPGVDVALMGASAAVLAGRLEDAERYVEMAKRASFEENRVFQPFRQKEIEKWDMLLMALKHLKH